PRFGTPADQWGDPVDDAEKKRRSQRLTEVSQRTGREHVYRFLGRTMRVLVEGKIKKGELLEGTTDNWITVRMVGSPTLARTMQWVRLDEERDGTAYGEVVAAPSPTQLQVV
ncbi:MAG TPA: hypothetical protein VNI20_04750, partial [Fimbriimonadaceae bacterium]|nr:hypothetical protein [Fimbriimonadaceae bacterium]